MVALEHAGVGEVGGQVEPRLSTQRGQQGVGLLARYDPLDRLDRQRFEVHAVGDLFVGHDRRGVGVDQHDLDPFLTQRLARLRTRVVELRGLADDDGTRAQDQDLARPRLLRHPGHRSYDGRAAADHVNEAVIEVLVVLRARAAFGVVLDAEHGQSLVAEALYRAVVEIALRDIEVARRNRVPIDLEFVVLAGDVDPAGVEVLDGVVGAVVAIREARGRRPSRPTEDLMPEADAQQRDSAEGMPRQLDRSVQNGRIPWAVGENQPVGAKCLHVRPRGRMRQHDDSTASLAQRAKDVRLDAVVDDCYEQALAIASPPSLELGRQWLQPLLLVGA